MQQRFVYIGYKRAINKEDFRPIDEFDSSAYCTQRLANEWDKAVTKYNTKRKTRDEADIQFVSEYNKVKEYQKSF